MGPHPRSHLTIYLMVRVNTKEIGEATMQNSVRKIYPLAIAMLLALCGAAIAGDNANVDVSLDGAAVISGVGAGATIEVALSGTGLVGVKQFNVTLTVSPADAFDLSASTFAQNAAAFTISPGVEFPADGQVKSGAASFGAAVDGDAALGTFTLTTSDSFTADTEATITVSNVSIGPTSTDRDVFDAATLELSVTVNPPAPPVIEPTLSANSLTDVSLDYSAVGSGDVDDDSDGEIVFSVNFTDSTNDVGEGQTITWDITNNGSESVFLIGVGEIAAGSELSVESATDADGDASATFDAEGDKSAGTTSLSVSASTTADNSDGDSRDLSVDFSATWDVPVAAELASFASQVTVDDNVLLQWGVASQSNNLGWEVFRSTDNRVFAKVSDLIVGEGTSDEFSSYSYTDSNLPVADVLYYHLNQIDLDGTMTRSQVIEVLLSPTAVSQQALPLANSLKQNYPNPFNPETTISYDLSGESVVTLTIYDLSGQVIRTMVNNQAMSVGQYKSVWDGRDESGIKVASGVYFYQLQTGDFVAKKKMTLLQ
ncbi:MAG TPA: T9SS type A sorting domain-containing protein [Candidatus Handelsmanbacteria bacterium]|nr:T9SS type A sorting domain-containing protein [Candidatus Handelsmanbacteria bacterium]